MTAENSDLALYKFTAFRKLKCPPSQGCPVASKAPVGVVGRGPPVPADVHIVLRAMVGSPGTCALGPPPGSCVAAVPVAPSCLPSPVCPEELRGTGRVGTHLARPQAALLAC